MGDLSELMASIAEKGIIEPHHRPAARTRASRSSPASGATRRPCRSACGRSRSSSAKSDDNEIIEIALIENIQRKDLTPFEEAEALHSLATRCNYTHEDMARRLGKSRTADYRVAVAERHARTRSKTFVGWPTFTLSRCFYR